MKLIIEIFLFFLNFKLFSSVFIDSNIEKYFNQEYIKEARKLKKGDFYLFEINKNKTTFTMVNKFKSKNGNEINENRKFTIYRSTSEIDCNSLNETTNIIELKEKKYLDVVVENIYSNDGILYVDNINDNPEKYLNDHTNLRYKDKNYIKLEDKCSIIFKIVVKEEDPVTNNIDEIEKYCFCSDMFYLFAQYKREDEYFCDSFKYSLFDNEKIVEFYLINPFLKYKEADYIDKNRNSPRISNNYKTEINGKMEGDIDGLIYYDDDDVDKRAEICLRGTFKNCLNLRKISLENGYIYNALTNDIFKDCKNLEELDIKNIIFLNLIYFRNFNNLESLKLHYDNKDHEYSFANCKKLKEIRFVTNNGTEKKIDELIVGNAGFKNCPELEYIGAKKIVIDSKIGNTCIFENCKKLKIPDVIFLLHKNVSVNYPNLKNIFNGIDSEKNKEVKIGFKFADNDSKIRYNLDFNTIFNGCDSKKNIEITTPDNNKIILENVQNNDKIDEFLLDPVRYIKHRKFYQKVTQEQLESNNYFEGVNLDDENERNRILNFNNHDDGSQSNGELNNDIPKGNSCFICCAQCFAKCCCCCHKSKT